jgi:cyclophilin family peptidyl-prolyl cis-trans isomerase
VYITRDDVGFIDLNNTEPAVTDVCWMDIQIGESEPQRIEISLYGKVCPLTAENFKSLCQNAPGYGYRGSDIFRIISGFSVQGGNIGEGAENSPSKRSRFGKAASGQSFLAENYRILHSYRDAGVVSMMKGNLYCI